MQLLLLLLEGSFSRGVMKCKKFALVSAIAQELHSSNKVHTFRESTTEVVRQLEVLRHLQNALQKKEMDWKGHC